MKIPSIRFAFTDDEILELQNDVAAILKSGYLTMGARVREFEILFRDFVGARYAVAVNSGTSALEIALRAKDIRGRTVIVPDVTFMATPMAVMHAGGRVALVDVRREDLSIDPDCLERAIRNDTAGVILVHIGGFISGYLDHIRRICRDRGLFLIEDAAHAHGSRFQDRPAGTLGDAAAFSFYPTKVLTTGEGGMMTTNDEAIYKAALCLREHGKSDPSVNRHVELGYNWRFSELHAVLGIQQVKKAAWLVSERQRLAALYDRLLEDTMTARLRPVQPAKETSCAYHKYVVYLESGFDRDRIKARLRTDFDIALSGEVYSEPCHVQPVFQRYPESVVPFTGDDFPVSTDVCRDQICLPLYPGLTEDEVVYVVDSLKHVVNEEAPRSARGMFRIVSRSDSTPSATAVERAGPRKAIVIECRNTGDVLFTTPVIRALSRAGYEVDALVADGSAGIFDGHPLVNRVLVWTGDSAVDEIRRAGYGLAVVADLFPWPAEITASCGIPVRVGYDRGVGSPSRGRWLTHLPPRRKNIREIEANLDLIRHLGIPDAGPEIDVARIPSAEAWAEAVLGHRRRPRVLISPFVNPTMPYKAWPLDCFQSVGENLSKDGACVIVSGMAADREASRDMAARIPGAWSAAGEPDLPRLVSLIARCDLVVTHDALPLHIAAAVNVPTVSIWGPTDPRMYGGYGPAHCEVRMDVECGPCFRRGPSWPYRPDACPFNIKCLSQIPADRVLDAARSALERRNAHDLIPARSG